MNRRSKQLRRIEERPATGYGSPEAGRNYPKTSLFSFFPPRAVPRRILAAMQTFLAKCAALALIVGGFACTGDLARLAARFTRLLNATTVPVEEQQPLEDALRPEIPVAPQVQAPARHAFDAPLGRRVEIPPPPADSPDGLVLESLRPGDRVQLWLGRPGTPTSFLAFDVVDPAAGELLTAQPLPRRMRLVAADGDARQIGKGQRISLAPLGIVHGTAVTGPTETFGPVMALRVQPSGRP